MSGKERSQTKEVSQKRKVQGDDRRRDDNSDKIRDLR